MSVGGGPSTQGPFDCVNLVVRRCWLYWPGHGGAQAHAFSLLEACSAVVGLGLTRLPLTCLVIRDGRFNATFGLVDLSPHHIKGEGSSVLSLCGYWFVPTADHTKVDTCVECSKRHEQMVVAWGYLQTRAAGPLAAYAGLSTASSGRCLKESAPDRSYGQRHLAVSRLVK